MPAKRGHAPVAFDEAAWSEDLRQTTDTGRTTATRKRAQLERDGQPVEQLLACDLRGKEPNTPPAAGDDTPEG
jgi:hypothetical protein